MAFFDAVVLRIVVTTLTLKTNSHLLPSMICQVAEDNDTLTSSDAGARPKIYKIRAVGLIEIIVERSARKTLERVTSYYFNLYSLFTPLRGLSQGFCSWEAARGSLELRTTMFCTI